MRLTLLNQMLKKILERSSMVLVMFVLNFYKTLTFFNFVFSLFFFFKKNYALRGETHKREKKKTYLAPLLTNVGYKILAKLTLGR